MSVRLLPTSIAASALGSARPGTATAEGPSLGYPGRDPRRPAVLLLDFDHSYSVIGMGGNDPVGQRFDEAWQAIRHVARYSHGRTLVGLLHFDQPCLGNLAPAPIARQTHLRALHAGLRAPSDAVGSSCLEPSLAIAEQYAATHPGADVWFVPFSDFELTDDDPADVLRRLARFPGRVLAVSLGGAPPLPLGGPELSVCIVTPMSRPGTTAKVVFAALTQTRPGADRTCTEGLIQPASGSAVADSTTRTLPPEPTSGPLNPSVPPTVQPPDRTVVPLAHVAHNQYAARPAASA